VPAEINGRTGATGGSDSQQDPLPSSAPGFRGPQLRSRLGRRPGCGHDELIDQGSGPQTAIGSRHVDLELAGDVIGSEAARDGQTIVIRDHWQRSGTVVEFATGAGDREGKNNRGTCDWPVVVVFYSHRWIVGHALVTVRGDAFALYYDDVNAHRDILRISCGEQTVERNQKTETNRKETL